MKMMRAAAVLVCASVLSLVCASAATISWTNDAGGSFSDVNNWQGGVVPAELDIALFTNTTDYSITLDVSVTNSEARFNAGSGLLDVDFAGSSWTLTNALYVGQVSGSDAEVALHAGEFLSRSISLATSNSAAGYLTLASITGRVTASAGLGVGGQGTGTLVLADADAALIMSGGGVHVLANGATSAGTLLMSNGFLSVSGNLTVGNSGRGEFLMLNGTGLISSTLSVGINSGSVGVVTLAGPGADLSIGGATLGAAVASKGTLYLSNGIMRTKGQVKWGDNGDALVMLVGGSMICTDNLPTNAQLNFPFGAGTSRLVIASTESTLTQYGNNGGLLVPAGVGGYGDIIQSNGTLNAADVSLGAATGAEGRYFLLGGSNVLTKTGAPGLFIGKASYSTGFMVMAGSDTMFISTNSTGIAMGGENSTRSNSYGRLIISNGTVKTRGLRLGNGPSGVGELLLIDGTIINHTNGSGGTSISLGEALRSTGRLVMASSLSLIDATEGPAGTPTILGNSTGSVGILTMSNGTANLRRLVVGNNGYGELTMLNQSVLNINEGIYMPNDSANNGTGTGLLVLASADAVLNLTNGNFRLGGTWGGNTNTPEGARGSFGHLIVSNGTVNVKLLAPGQAGNGQVTILNGTIQQSSTAFGDGLKIANSSEGGTGLVVLAHANAVLNMPSNNLVMGNAANGTARLVISQGVVTVRAAVLGGLATQTNSYSEIVIEDGRLVTTFTDFQMGVSPLTRGLVLLKHANAQIIHTNGAVTLGNHSNTFSRLIMSNGYLYAASVQMANSSFTNRPGANGEWFIYNATNYLTASNSDSVVVAGKAGCTNLLVLAESGAVLEAPRNQSATWNTAYIANGGVGTLVMSNGLFRMGNFSVANGLGGVGTVYLENGRLEALNNVVIGNQGQAIVNVSGGLLIATNAGNGIDIGNGAGGSGTLNVSNGTVRTTFASTVGLGDGSTANLNVSGGEVDFSTTQFSLGWGTASVARLSVSGGSMTISQLVVVGGARATNCIATWELSGGTLNVARVSASSAVGATSNIWFSGGTLSAMANLTNTLVTTLTNSPGLGLVTFDSRANTILQSGLLTGPGGLAKDGAGTMTVTADNDYSGETRVQTGTLNLQGSGSLAGSDLIMVSAGATLSVQSRTDGSLNLGAGQSLVGAGTVQGSVTNLGTVDPGELVGALSITGDYDQAVGGTLNAELSLLGNDTLVVGGTARLGGTLDVSTLLYTPSAGSSFTVLTAQSISGTFATTNLPFLLGGATIDVAYPGATAVVLTVVSGVTPTPYESWAAGFGLSGTNAYDQADPDGDGYANLLEYAQGSDPTNSGSNVKIRMNLTNGAARLLIQRVNSATDIVYHVDAAYQVTNASWSTISSNVVGAWTGTATVDDNNTSAVHEVRIVDPVAAATNRFLRLRVERP